MGEGGAAGLRPSEGEQVSGSILRLASALPTGRFYRPVRVFWRPGQPPEEPQAFQGWMAGPIALLHSVVGRERPWEAPLRPHGTDGFQSGVQGLQPALLSLQDMAATARAPGQPCPPCHLHYRSGRSLRIFIQTWPYRSLCPYVVKVRQQNGFYSTAC